MSTTVDPYVRVTPGELITAELFNEIQRRIRADIDAEIAKAMAELEEVARAGNADKLSGQTADELSKTIVDRALREIPRRTGYLRVFKRLHLADPREVEYDEIEHGLKAFPLVDVYQLDYFPVMCRADDESDLAWVNFYLYHGSEKRIGRPQPVVIQESRGPIFRIGFDQALKEVGLEYDDGWSLANLVGEFWEKWFASPNDEFDENQFCHSPWFNRCCSDNRTVRDIRRAGDWDDLWLKLRPRKTINYPRATDSGTSVPSLSQGVAVPPDLEVVHFDLDRVGIRVIPPMVSGADLYLSDERAAVEFDRPEIEPPPNFAPDELKLMVLLQAGAPAIGQSGGGGQEGAGGQDSGHTHGRY